MAQPRRLVLGLGNLLAGEDGFGNAVIDALRRRSELDGSVEIRDAGTDVLAEIDRFGDYQEILLVDAVVGAERDGEVATIDESVFSGWPDRSPGCHGISPLLAVKLFRRLHPTAATCIRLVAWHTDALHLGAPVPASAIAGGVAAVISMLKPDGTRGKAFQACGSCRTRWDSWDTFVVDPKIRLLGFQAVPGLPDANLLVFEHGCGSSVSILTKRLQHLLPYDAVREAWPSLRGTEQCAVHCQSLADLAACDRPCSNARDRELIRLVQRMRAQNAERQEA